jgi:hypothetical protein
VKHDTAPARRAKRILLRYLDIALPNGARGEHAAAIESIVDAAVIAVRDADHGDPAGVGGASRTDALTEDRLMQSPPTSGAGFAC